MLLAMSIIVVCDGLCGKYKLIVSMTLNQLWSCSWSKMSSKRVKVPKDEERGLERLNSLFQGSDDRQQNLEVCCRLDNVLNDMGFVSRKDITEH